MRLLAVLAVAIIALALAGPPAGAMPGGPKAAAVPFDIDGAHSTLLFRIRHFGVANFYGRVNGPSGTFLIDPANLEDSFIDVTVEIRNMDAGNESRDRFLMGADFFNAREFPKATFKSKSIRAVDGGFEASGEFMMRGVTLPVTARIADYAESPTERFGYRSGFEATFDLKRSDYNMSKLVEEGTLGDDVRIIAAIEGVRAPDA